MCKLYKAVINLVAEETEIPISVIESKSRHEDVVSARQMVAYFCSKAKMPHSTIAQHLGITRQAVCQKIETINDKRMQKSLELYRYVDGKFGAIEARLAEQAVRNQGVADAIREVSKEIDYKVNLEAERRCCADNKIVSYVNGTFAPKLIADYTAGTTTTAANTYNPLCCPCNVAM